MSSATSCADGYYDDGGSAPNCDNCQFGYVLFAGKCQLASNKCVAPLPAYDGGSPKTCLADSTNVDCAAVNAHAALATPKICQFCNIGY